MAQAIAVAPQILAPGETSIAASAGVPSAKQQTRYLDSRLVAILFILDSMTADDLARSRQGALNFVANQMVAGVRYWPLWPMTAR